MASRTSSSRANRNWSSTVSLLWMHFAIRRMERQHFPQIGTETDLREIMAAAEQGRRG